MTKKMWELKYEPNFRENSSISMFIDAERVRQDKKWGVRNHSDLYWLGILMEEVGEVAKALIEGDGKHAFEELIQVAAVTIQWLEAIKRRIENLPENNND